MKILLGFELKENIIPLNYRPFIISFFKYSLEKGCNELYQKYYLGKYGIKNFCFSTYLKNAVFSKESIKTDTSFSITLSVFDISDAFDWYNAFLKQKGKEYKLPMENSMTLKSVKIENHSKVKNSSIIVKMLSPIAVRCVTNRKSKYLSYSDEEFIPKLKEISLSVLEKATGISKDNIPLEIEVLNGRKTVTHAVTHDCEKNITANLGIYRIHSDPIFLDCLYILGIGSRRSEGFGMFEIIS